MTRLEPRDGVRRIRETPVAAHLALPSPDRGRPQPNGGLDAWIAEKTLGGFVLQAVRRINEHELRRVAAPDAGIAFRPLTLLALVTYCYAVEIYGANEIEDLMRQDPTFRRLCGGEFPDRHLIRRFRRCNRDAIHQSLMETFRHARQSHSDPRAALKGNWDSHGGWNDRLACSGGARSAPSVDPFQGVDSTNLAPTDQGLAAEADRRIENAMWIDLMTTDE